MKTNENNLLMKMVEDLKNQNEALQNKVAAIEANFNKKIAEEVEKQVEARLGKKKLDRFSHPTCPDCGELLSWDSYHGVFWHNNDYKCVYQMNEYGDCVNSNAMRDERNKNLNF